MGYKTINLQTQVLKGSITPAKVIEAQQKAARPRSTDHGGGGGSVQGAASNRGLGCCERLNQNLHRWLETKFSSCPVSCFPFKLGDSGSTKSEPKQLRTKPNARVHVEKPVYQDCSDLNMWDYDIISLNKHTHSAVIDRDVNNSFCVIPALIGTPSSLNKTSETEVEHFDIYDEIDASLSKKQSARKRDLRSNSSASLKSKFEKRLGRIKKMGDENKIAETIELEEKSKEASRERLSVSTISKEPITFSSIFGDSSLFESELEDSRLDETEAEGSTREFASSSEDDFEDADEDKHVEKEKTEDVDQAKGRYLNSCGDESFELSEDSDSSSSSGSRVWYL